MINKIMIGEWCINASPGIIINESGFEQCGNGYDHPHFHTDGGLESWDIYEIEYNKHLVDLIKLRSGIVDDISISYDDGYLCVDDYIIYPEGDTYTDEPSVDIPITEGEVEDWYFYNYGVYKMQLLKMRGDYED